MTRAGGRRVEVDGPLEGARVDSDRAELRRRRAGLFVGIGPPKNILSACWHIGLSFVGCGVLRRQALAPAVPKVASDRRCEHQDNRDDCTGNSTTANTSFLTAGRVSCDARCVGALVAETEDSGNRHMVRGIRLKAQTWSTHRPIRTHCCPNSQLQLGWVSSQIRQPSAPRVPLA